MTGLREVVEDLVSDIDVVALFSPSALATMARRSRSALTWCSIASCTVAGGWMFLIS